MVHDVDVIVQMTARAVGVSDHEEVRAVHPLRELHAEIMHALNVLRVIHVELLRREVLRVGVHLVATMECSTHLLRTCNDLLRSPIEHVHHSVRVSLSSLSNF